MNGLFIFVQIVTGMLAVAALMVLFLIVLLRRTAALAKESLGTLGYIVALFTSGFTQGRAPKVSGWKVSLPQGGLGILVTAMLVSLFMPEARIFLHVVAGLAGVALLWYVRMFLTGVKLEVLCLPVVVVWFAYYLMCVFWKT